VNLALRKPSLPPRLQNGKLDTLPEQPGVYIMYGENGIPLYVGKSINIKDRVLSHFTSDIHSSTEMKISQQVESIETMTTPGELGALILESATIKKLLPLYNKKLRIKRELTAIKNKKNKEGYETISIEPVGTIKPEDINSDDTDKEKIIGLFKSRRQAKSFLTHVAKEYELCERLLQLESTNTACFAYRLGTCHGACVSEELPLKYNMRFIQAFSEVKFKPWPFPGPIAIEEGNQRTGEQQCFLIDKWCYLGSISGDTTGSTKQTIEEDVVFDLDLYKILFSYLKSPSKLKNVRQLSNFQEQNTTPLPVLE
jgi:DNA polymerase-3 subunit epsilon